MHFYKHKIGNCGQLSEANRSLYIDKDTGEYVRDSSTSLIDFDRTPYNYNLSKNDMSIQEIIDLNCKYRHVETLGKNQNAFCQLRVTLPQNFDIPGHPDFKYLVGEERIFYLLDHPDAKVYVDNFFKNAMKSLQEHFDISDEDICSAWVHYDESNPHMHMLFIPVVHEQDKTAELTDNQKKKLERYQELDKLTDNPQAFCERIKSDYENKLLKLPKDSKSYKNTQTDLRKLLAKTTDKEKSKYAKEKHRFFKSEIKKLTAEKVEETVSVDKKFNRKNLSDMFDKVSEDLTQALGFVVNMRTGESLGYDVQKCSKEYKKQAMQEKQNTLNAKKEADYAQKQADDSVERMYNTSVQANKAEKRLENLQKDNTAAELENMCLKAENNSLANEKLVKQTETEELQKIQDNVRANLTALTGGYYVKEYNKAMNRGDKQAANSIMTTVFQRSELCDQYKLENTNLSRMNKRLTTECNENQIFREALKEEVKTEDEILKMINDDTITNSEISNAIKLYAIMKNDTETNSILKTCQALDKIQAFSDKSLKHRQDYMKKHKEPYTEENFAFIDYDNRIRAMLKKSLKYEDRTEIYKGSYTLKNLWADIQADNSKFWEKRKTPKPDGLIKLEDLIPRLIQSAVQAIRNYIDLIKQAQQQYDEYDR